MKKARYRDFEELRLQNGRGQRHKCCFETQSGITLVALVVTIVVLLILAGITITYVFSDNGILSQAQSAANKTDAATVLEEIQSKLLARQLANTDTWTYSNTDVIEVIEEVAGVTVDEWDDDFTTENGNKVEISSLWVDGSSSSVSGSGPWYYADDGSVTNGTITLEIGDYVDYTSGTVSYTSTSDKNGSGSYSFSDYTGTWQVLGVDTSTGGVLLISSSSVGTLLLHGKIGYENCETELEYIGSLFANGTGAASGRSVTVEDINKITGYNPNNVGVNDPEQTGEGTKYCEGALSEYGNVVTYSWTYDYYPYYSASNGLTGYLTVFHDGFCWYDDEGGWSEYGDDYSMLGDGCYLATYESNYYQYQPTTLTIKVDNEASTGISSESPAYSLLFTMSYWLGSRYVLTGEDYGTFGCRMISSSSHRVGGTTFVYSSGGTYGVTSGVRPVVSLESNISLESSGTNSWTIS